MKKLWYWLRRIIEQIQYERGLRKASKKAKALYRKEDFNDKPPH